MKIMLFSSNLFSQFPQCYPNGTGALSSFLKSNGYEVKMIHLTAKKELNKINEFLNNFNPDVVGVSIMTCEFPLVQIITETVKKWKNIPVICGGVHVIIDPLSVLSMNSVDAICRGEGEYAFLDYLQKFEKGENVSNIPGFWIKRGNEIIKNPPLPFISNLDTLPYPDRSQINIQKIINANNGVINVLLGRGCNWHCRFCCNNDISKANTGTYVRNRSVDGAIKELEFVTQNYKINTITIRDDNFPWDKNWAISFLKEYKKRLTHKFEIFARVDCLDHDIIDSLKEAGCHSVFMGLDSGNDYIRNEVLHKKQSNKTLVEICSYMKKVGVNPVLSNIVGLPYETKEMHQDTININKQICGDKMFFSPSFGVTPKIWVFDPWPGTELYKICKENGWLKSDERKHKVYRQSSLNMKQFSPREINKCFRRFHYEVYKDKFPIKAWIYRLYDNRISEEIMERMPHELVGIVRTFLLKFFNLKFYLDIFKNSILKTINLRLLKT